MSEIIRKKALASSFDGHEQLKTAIGSYLESGLGNPVANRIAFMIEYPDHPEMTKDDYEAEDHPGPLAFANMKTVVATVRADIDDA